MSDCANTINVRLRLIIIKNNRLLCSYTKTDDIYFYVGGHLEFGESILDGCIREIKEECGPDTTLDFKKILYIRDYLRPDQPHHSVELFILADINKFEELEKKLDDQHSDGSMWLTWLDLDNLPDNLYPQQLSAILLTDYKTNFSNSGRYVGALK